MVMKRRSSPATRVSMKNQVVACVTYGREVLVPNPKDRFQNQKFRYELTDARYDNESYEQVRARLKAEVNRMLAEDIAEYLGQVIVRERTSKMDDIKRQFNLF